MTLKIAIALMFPLVLCQAQSNALRVGDIELRLGTPKAEVLTGIAEAHQVTERKNDWVVLPVNRNQGFYTVWLEFKQDRLSKITAELPVSVTGTVETLSSLFLAISTETEGGPQSVVLGSREYNERISGDDYRMRVLTIQFRDGREIQILASEMIGESKSHPDLPRAMVQISETLSTSR